MERNNRGEGLALYWRNSLNLSIDTSQRTILMPSSIRGKKIHGDSMVNQLPTNVVNPRIGYANSITGSNFHGYVHKTLMKLLKALRNWVEVTEVKLKCSYLGMSLTNAESWILVSWELHSHGRSILQRDTPFGKGWIVVW